MDFACEDFGELDFRADREVDFGVKGIVGHWNLKYSHYPNTNSSWVNLKK